MPRSHSYSRSASPPPRHSESARHHRRRSYTPSRSPSPRRRHHSPDSPPSRTHHYRSRSRSPRRCSPSSRQRYRSPSPARRYRSRSRSPPRKKEGKGNMSGAFKWKDPKASSTTDEAATSKPKTLERGYNEAPPRPRSPPHDDIASKFGADYSARYARKPPPPQEGENDLPSALSTDDPPKKKEKKKKSSAGPKPTAEPLIIVNINDRLGTKASIPCLASDPVRLFKAQVAARIGREPHEIKLQRQGERPFKDMLTLEDYGVSSGVQLDLEVDTGD